MVQAHSLCYIPPRWSQAHSLCYIPHRWSQAHSLCYIPPRWSRPTPYVTYLPDGPGPLPMLHTSQMVQAHSLCYIPPRWSRPTPYVTYLPDGPRPTPYVTYLPDGPGPLPMLHTSQMVQAHSLCNGCFSFSNSAHCHVLPPSMDTSTRIIPRPPPLHA